MSGSPWHETFVLVLVLKRIGLYICVGVRVRLSCPANDLHADAGSKWVYANPKLELDGCGNVIHSIHHLPKPSILNLCILYFLV